MADRETVQVALPATRPPLDSDARSLETLTVDDAMRWIEPGWPDTVPLDVVELAHPALQRVPAIVGDDAGQWLDGRLLASDHERRQFLCDLQLRTGPDDKARFRKSAIVAFGRPRQTSDGWQVPVEWRSATLAPLFPVFAGYLEVQADRVAVHGRYAPPGGRIGQALDAAVLHVAARATAAWFLGCLAAALG